MNNQVPIIGQSQPPRNQMTASDAANMLANPRIKLFMELSKNQEFISETAHFIAVLADSIKNHSRDGEEGPAIIAASNVVAKFL